MPQANILERERGGYSGCGWYCGGKVDIHSSMTPGL